MAFSARLPTTTNPSSVTATPERSRPESAHPGCRTVHSPSSSARRRWTPTAPARHPGHRARPAREARCRRRQRRTLSRCTPGPCRSMAGPGRPPRSSTRSIDRGEHARRVRGPSPWTTDCHPGVAIVGDREESVAHLQIRLDPLPAVGGEPHDRLERGLAGAAGRHEPVSAGDDICQPWHLGDRKVLGRDPLPTRPVRREHDHRVVGRRTITRRHGDEALLACRHVQPEPGPIERLEAGCGLPLDTVDGVVGAKGAIVLTPRTTAVSSTTANDCSNSTGTVPTSCHRLSNCCPGHRSPCRIRRPSHHHTPRHPTRERATRPQHQRLETTA